MFFRYEWSEIAFTLLGIESKSCRKRLICEMDFKAKKVPIFGYAYNYLSRSFLSEYRSINDVVNHSNDCARMYKCSQIGEDEDSDADNEDVKEEEAEEVSEPVGKIILKRNKKTKNN